MKIERSEIKERVIVPKRTEQLITVAANKRRTVMPRVKKHNFVRTGKLFDKPCKECNQPLVHTNHYEPARPTFVKKNGRRSASFNANLHTLLTTDHIAKANGLTSYEGGATRSVKQERRELIPKTAMDALARRLAMGAAKHGVNNWRKGGEEFRLATVNHLLDHIFEYLENGGSENTDAIICNAAFLCEYEARESYKGDKC